MSACKLNFFIGIGVLLLGVFFLLCSCRQREPFFSIDFKKLTLGHYLSILILICGSYLTVNNFSAYVSCAAVAGTCPSSFPAGSSGYTCSNEYTQCAWTKNCITTPGFFPWESACECKCVNTHP